MIEVSIREVEKVAKAQAALLQAANAVCSGWMEDAHRRLNDFAQREMIEVSDVDPHLSLDLKRPGEVVISLSYPCRTRDQFKVEQKILQAYIESMASNITLDNHSGDGIIGIT